MNKILKSIAIVLSLIFVSGCLILSLNKEKYAAFAEENVNFTHFNNFVEVIKEQPTDEDIIEDFINDYLHMDDYNENEGKCHEYYEEMKEALNNLTDEQRKLLGNDPRYSDAYDRILAWGTANGENIYIDSKNGHISFEPYNTNPIIANDETQMIIAAVAVVTSALSFGIVLAIIKIKKPL